MKSVNRRSAMTAAAAGAVAVGAAAVGRAAGAGEQKAPELWTLEGELKIHPKYLYRYYLVLGGGQTCGLYSAEHGREPEQLARLKPPVCVRVRGTLGTEHHAGGTNSPFPETWMVYMNVHEVEELK